MSKRLVCLLKAFCTFQKTYLEPYLFITWIKIATIRFLILFKFLYVFMILIVYFN